MASTTTAVSGTKLAASMGLQKLDPQLWGLIQAEREHQSRSVSLIASENYTPLYCNDALSSGLSMKYSEGYPGDRYYAGNKFIDQIETLCQDRALRAFHLDPKEWRVNVQALSGSPANFAVYTALLTPLKSRILYMDLPHGGHLSHGYGKPSAPVSATGKYFVCKPYRLNPRTELVDYDEIEAIAKQFKPDLIVAGYSAYSRLLDYKRFRQIADSVGAILHGDIAHIAGPMSARLIPSAFDYCDVVTTTTHKTLRGPRGALIFSRKHLAKAIDKAVFPGCQGGPHNHTIAAIAAALKACREPEFEAYQRQTLNNAKIMGKVLQAKGVRLVTGGTDNHLVLADLTKFGVSGIQAEKALETINIISNKNTVLSDKSPKKPNGLRLGSPAMTTRGMREAEFEELATIVYECIAQTTNYKAAGNRFLKKIQADPKFDQLRTQVARLTQRFPCIPSRIWN